MIGLPKKMAYELALALLILNGVATEAAAQPVRQGSSSIEIPGATLESLLTLVRQANPELRMAAEDAQAAKARVGMAGALMDPTVTLLSSENMLSGGEGMSTSNEKFTVSVQQGFPLGGKRGLAKRSAEASARQQGHLERDMEQDVAMRLKMAFAENYQAIRVREGMVEIRDLLSRLAVIAEGRYVQGRGMQQDVLMLQADTAMMEADILRMDAERAAMRARINALIARDSETELADPVALRPLPAETLLTLDRLIGKLRERNPSLAALSAQAEAAESSAELMRRSWWPDLMVGVGLMTARDGTRSYEVMMGFNLPLQVGPRNAQIAEGAAMFRAARARLDNTLFQQQAELAAQLAELKAQRSIHNLLAATAIPRNQIALKSAASSFELGRGEVMGVLDAARRLRETRIELLKVEVEADKRLATIERLIGEDL